MASLSSITKTAFRGMQHIAFLFTVAAIVNGCAIAPPAVENADWSRHRDQLNSLDSWQMRGRVNVRYDDESHTPRIIWQQNEAQYNIRLWGTFNAGNTTIVGSPGFVTLEQDGEEVTANSPEELILQQLGYELPVSYLEHWIKGMPAPESPADLQFNDINQLTRLVQDGWTVYFEDLRQYGDFSLPRRVELTRPQNDIRLRFVGLNWTVPSEAPSSN